MALTGVGQPGGHTGRAWMTVGEDDKRDGGGGGRWTVGHRRGMVLRSTQPWKALLTLEGTLGKNLEGTLDRTWEGELLARCLNRLPLLWLPDGLLDPGDAGLWLMSRVVAPTQDHRTGRGRVGGELQSKTRQRPVREQEHGKLNSTAVLWKAAAHTCGE